MCGFRFEFKQKMYSFYWTTKFKIQFMCSCSSKTVKHLPSEKLPLRFGRKFCCSPLCIGCSSVSVCACLHVVPTVQLLHAIFPHGREESMYFLNTDEGIKNKRAGLVTAIIYSSFLFQNKKKVHFPRSASNYKTKISIRKRTKDYQLRI